MMKGSKGFTLLEMTIVVTLMALLAAIAVPALTGQVTKGRTNTAASDLAQLQQAVDAFAQNGEFPTDTLKKPTIPIGNGTPEDGCNPDQTCRKVAPEGLLAIKLDAVTFQDGKPIKFSPDVLRLPPRHATGTVTVQAGSKVLMTVPALPTGTRQIILDNSSGAKDAVIPKWNIDSSGLVWILSSPDQY